CQRQGWEYVEYTERMSGTKADRQAFQQLFEDARLKKFDLVLFWALDRFSREGVTETLNHLKVLTAMACLEEFHRILPGLHRHVQRSSDCDSGGRCQARARAPI